VAVRAIFQPIDKTNLMSYMTNNIKEFPMNEKNILD
jgi:hypothetical protein